MASPETASEARLAERLKELRLTRWPGRPITQLELADAIGVSVPSVSSWESAKRPARPPVHRLEALATFYATRRSVVDNRPWVLATDDLTSDEIEERQRLLEEFGTLGARPTRTEGVVKVPLAYPRDTIGGGAWWFPDGAPITIICPRLPRRLRERMPYTDFDDPDYVRYYTIGDIDALVEVHGHIRAVNPASYVAIRAHDEVVADDFTTHVVLIGGLDFNKVTKELINELHLPIRQQPHGDESHDDYTAAFEVVEGSQTRLVRPVIQQQAGGGSTLREDVACFYRGDNPNNRERTVTICTGMFSRGTLGAVRTLTDQRFRGRNEDYLSRRFAQGPPYGILSRVKIVRGETVTPDWTDPRNRLFEWPDATS